MLRRRSLLPLACFAAPLQHLATSLIVERIDLGSAGAWPRLADIPTCSPPIPNSVAMQPLCRRGRSCASTGRCRPVANQCSGVARDIRRHFVVRAAGAKPREHAFLRLFVQFEWGVERLCASLILLKALDASRLITASRDPNPRRDVGMRSAGFRFQARVPNRNTRCRSAGRRNGGVQMEDWRRRASRLICTARCTPRYDHPHSRPDRARHRHEQFRCSRNWTMAFAWTALPTENRLPFKQVL